MPVEGPDSKLVVLILFSVLIYETFTSLLVTLGFGSTHVFDIRLWTKIKLNYKDSRQIAACMIFWQCDCWELNWGWGPGTLFQWPLFFSWVVGNVHCVSWRCSPIAVIVALLMLSCSQRSTKDILSYMYDFDQSLSHEKLMSVNTITWQRFLNKTKSVCALLHWDPDRVTNFVQPLV